MIAVILAAGRGTRLEAITRNKPKCLVNVNGRPILDRQIDALLEINEITKVIVVCGYRAEQIKAHIANHYSDEPRLMYVENKDFSTTNNMYSLYLTREYIAGSDLILMNADVAFDPTIVRDLAQTSCSSICVDIGKYSEESMKVVEKDDWLVSISKMIKQAVSLGVSIDIYRFTPDGTDVLLGEISEIIGTNGELNEWTELALDRLMRKGDLRMQAFDIGGRAWYEIDNLEDLWRAETLFGHSELDWSSIKVAFVDMDGTLFSGNTAIPGAESFFSELTKRVPNVFLLSNNSSKDHAEYAKRLSGLGIKAEDKQILLSSDALLAFLKNDGIKNVYAVGTKSFVELLIKHDIAVTENTPEAVILAYDTELTYEKLKIISIFLQNSEIPYYATHIDMVCPTEQGDIPDIGSMIKLLEATTGRVPDLIFGKPEVGMVQHVYNKIGVSALESLFIGDRVYTDYELAHRCGAQFVGVLTGDSDRADFESCRNITVYPSVADVFPAKG